MGIVLTADGVAEAVVPMVVATMRDGAGSYGPGFALLASLALVGAPRWRSCRGERPRRVSRVGDSAAGAGGFTTMPGL